MSSKSFSNNNFKAHREQKVGEGALWGTQKRRQKSTMAKSGGRAINLINSEH
jgi:hypothetical protein